MEKENFKTKSLKFKSKREYLACSSYELLLTKDRIFCFSNVCSPCKPNYRSNLAKLVTMVHLHFLTMARSKQGCRFLEQLQKRFLWSNLKLKKKVNLFEVTLVENVDIVSEGIIVHSIVIRNLLTVISSICPNFNRLFDVSIGTAIKRKFLRENSLRKIQEFSTKLKFAFQQFHKTIIKHLIFITFRMFPQRDRLQARWVVVFGRVNS